MHCCGDRLAHDSLTDALSTETANAQIDSGLYRIYLIAYTGALLILTGWLLSPMIAALAMSLSSASVITNALRLRSAALKPD